MCLVKKFLILTKDKKGKSKANNTNKRRIETFFIS